MKQRACIAIAICLRPKVIIADEPTSALDVVVQRQVMETLGRVQTELGAAVILIGHDMGLMAQFVDRLGIMYAGRLVEVAPIGDIITAPRHPYTRMLIDSLPSLERKGGLRGIPGLAPLLRELPSGCAFHPRCPMASKRAAGSRSRRCAMWRRTQPSRAISHDRHADRTALIVRARRLRRRHPRTRTQGRAGTFSFAVDAERPRIIAVVGRERQRQDHAGAAAAGPGRADRGRGAVQGPRLAAGCPRPSGANSASTVQAIFQDPYEVYNPFYRVDHVLTTPVRKFRPGAIQGSGARADRAGVARRRPAAGRDPGPLSAPTVRRPAPAHHGRPRAAAAAAADRGRRAGVDGRCVVARDHPGQPAQAARGAGHFHHLHHARSRDGLSGRRHHPGAVPRRRWSRRATWNWSSRRRGTPTRSC